MSSSRTLVDPAGHYARLGVAPWASPEEIVTAYRRQARLVHPDVPGTGSADAFMALKQAYDVLNNPELRTAYDREARRDAAPEIEPGEIGPAVFRDVAAPPTRHPRWRDLPIAVWVGMAVILTIGLAEVARHLIFAPAPPRREQIPATARDVTPPDPKAPATPPRDPLPVRLAGTPNFYVVPTATPAMLWRMDEASQKLVPWGQLPAFSALQGVRFHKHNGMVEVRITETTNGFVEAVRLSPGDASVAARAWCTYNAGPTPGNGEVLTRAVSGAARMEIGNRSGQPAVVKVRYADGKVGVSVFLNPGGETILEGLPPEPARIEFATGEVWSRSCRAFTAGMRAQALNEPVKAGAVERLEIPPGIAMPLSDLTDQAFQRP